MSRRVVITDSAFPDHDQELALLSSVGATLAIEDCQTEDDVIEVSAGAEILLVQWARIGRRLFDARPEVRLVIRYGIGLDNIDLAAAAACGVAVANVPDYCIDEVAEHTVMMLLAVQRRLLTFDRLMRASDWEAANAVAPPRTALAEQTIGVIGFGRVGRRTASILQSFGATIRAFDPGIAPSELAAAGVVPAATLTDLSDCDAVNLHCPLTDETRGIVGAAFLESLPNHAIIVNTSRGGLVDTDALVAALERHEIGGAALDTFSLEPLPADHPLLSFPNVVATPNVAWISEAARLKLQSEAGREAVRFLTGEPLRCAAMNGQAGPEPTAER